MTTPPKRVLLGHIAGAHGIRGEVLIKTYTAAPENIAAYGPLQDDTGQKSFKLKVVRVTPKGVVARITGVADRTSAERLKGIGLHVERARMGEAALGEYYYSDLVGLTAVTTDGIVIGHVKSVNNFGAGDLLELAFNTNGRTEFIPFTDAYVPTVDVAKGLIVVDLPADDATRPEDEPPDAPS